MAITYTTVTAEQILHKPVKIKNVVQGILALVPNVISSPAAANAINLIFDDIQTHANLLTDEMTDVKDDLFNHSNYLYKTTDEITLEMQQDLSNTTYVQTVRTELSNIFDKMQLGYTESTNLSMDIVKLVGDFYTGNTSRYYTNPSLYSDGTFDSEYSIATMDNIVSKFINANARHYEFKTTLGDLLTKYPNISIEEIPNSPIARQWVGNQIWIGFTGSAGSPTMRLYTAGTMGVADYTSASYSIWEDTIILDSATTYTLYVSDQTSSGTTASWLDDSATPSPITIPAGTAVSGAVLRGLQANKSISTDTAAHGFQSGNRVFFRQ